MKITEIIWEDGKKYKTTGSIYEVKNHDLVTNDGVKLTKIFSMQTLSQINFEEVIEPVDYKTALDDCFYNHNKYQSTIKGQTVVMSFRKFEDGIEGVFIGPEDGTYLGFILEEPDVWIKVV